MTTNGRVHHKLGWLPWTIAWSFVGCGWAVGIVGILSIGLLPLSVATIAALLLERRSTSLVGIPGVLAGPALIFLVLAYLNIGGPGEVCTGKKPNGVHHFPGDPPTVCTELWNPLLFLGVAAGLLAAAVIVQARVLVRMQRSRATRACAVTADTLSG